MKSKSILLFTLSILLLVALFSASAVSGQQVDPDTIARRGGNTRVEWRPQVAYESAVLTVAGPNGYAFQREFPAGVTPYFQTNNVDGSLLDAGSYTYEIQLTPILSAETKAELAAAPDDTSRQALVSELSTSGIIPDAAQLTISGYLTVQNGKFLTDNIEEEEIRPSVEAYSPNGIASPNAITDQVILDDLIVDGSACIGFDCVNGESFGFDTIRIKENNLRIRAQDTSSSASFPSNDWQITFNDSANGGANKFSIDDIDGGRTPFTIEAGAPSHSLYVDDGGRLGLGTSTPVVDVHVKSGNTPTYRLEQDGTSGFTPQTWDVAGNEANFFVRDATNGSTLPFRIFPGAPTNALIIEASTGDIGIGTASPTQALEVNGRILSNSTSATYTNVGVNLNDVTASATSDFIQYRNNLPRWTFRVSGAETGSDSGSNMTIERYNDAGSKLSPAPFSIRRSDGNVGIGTTTPTEKLDVAGNIVADGTITGLSSRAMKENLVGTDGNVLDRVMDLPIYFYNYIADGDTVQHVGPMSEDFVALFEVGKDNKHIAPMDLAGVAIAAVQELYASDEAAGFELREMQTKLNKQQDRIAELEVQNENLEARLVALEALVLAQMEENDKGD